ncbi:MAG TPA: membrane protein insertase YidC [Bacteroidota bacterium]|nr:membrane protein insertase YidC [Bacteroidota bacterium]
MEKRVILFLVLSLAIIFGYEYVLKELGVLPQLPAPSESTAPSSSQSPTPSVLGPANEPSNIPASETSSVKSAVEDLRPRGPEGGPIAAETVEVDTNLYRAKFTTRGAVMTSWELKHYRGSLDEQPAVQLVRQGGKFPGPLAVITDDTVLANELGEGLYKVEKDFTTLEQAHPDGHVTFYYENAEKGVRLEKRLTFHADSYVVDIAVKERGLDGSVNVVLGTNFGIVEWGDGFIGLIGPASLVDGKVEKETPDFESERKGTVQWAALQDKYFLSVLIPKQSSSVLVKKEGDKLVSTGVRMPVISSGTTLGLQLYAGPKEYDTLRSLQIGLEDTIDFGWFIFGSWGAVKAVAKPIFYVLRFINDYTHNYGLTIIVLTLAIKMLFVPLQYKSYKSMKQMQVIQPKVSAIQEKFKDDRDRLNKELIKLYRDHKANPVGGCLPMVLQMPVFVALFNILYMTIDLRQAPLGLWITDLSVQDPYYVLPVVMGVTMMIQQKITPTTMDPTQAKIMMMLPAFMTFLFINFPAGLVLYWLTNNTLTIGQQIVTERFILRNPSVPSATDDGAEKK